MIKACLRIEMRKALVNKAAMISCTGVFSWPSGMQLMQLSYTKIYMIICRPEK